MRLFVKFARVCLLAQGFVGLYAMIRYWPSMGWFIAGGLVAFGGFKNAYDLWDFEI